MTPLIINVALTGMVTSKSDNPALPVTPDEIVADVARCYDAGAAMFHIHARDETGQPTWHREIYAEIVAGIRAARPKAVICLSTSGRRWSDVELRVEALDVDGVDMASLTVGSLNFRRDASVNAPKTILALVKRMGERDIKPELEVFDHGMVAYTRYLLVQRFLVEPLYVNLLLGTAAPADPLHLVLMARDLPEGSIWAATGLHGQQFRVNCWAVAMGGHVRVGLEDWLWSDPDRQCLTNNAQMVERIVAVGRAVGREPADAGWIREALCLNF